MLKGSALEIISSHVLGTVMFMVFEYRCVGRGGEEMGYGEVKGCSSRSRKDSANLGLPVGLAIECLSTLWR